MPGKENTQTPPAQTPPAQAPTPQTPPAQSQAPRDHSENLLAALREERAKIQTLKAEQAAWAQEKQEFESALSTIQGTYSQEMALTEMGFRTPSVRRFLRREFDAALQEMPEGEDRPKIDAWLSEVKDDPLFAPHFERVAKASQPQNTETLKKIKAAAEAGDLDEVLEVLGAKPEPKPEKEENGGGAGDFLAQFQALLKGADLNEGAGGPPKGTQSSWTGGDVDRIRRKNRGTLGAQKSSVLASLRKQGLIK